MKKKLEKNKITVIGLGYIGLPIAIAFSKFYEVIGFDINKERISQLKLNKDITKEISTNNLKKNKRIKYTSDSNDIKDSNIYIVTVPTPIDRKNLPDLKILKSVTILISRYLKKNDVVIYESTVYPGATEEVCVPLLASGSKLKFNQDFFVGYSPERINPGDKIHTLENVNKIVSGSNKFALTKIFKLYSKIITNAKIYTTSSIKIAESAKIIENIQRDVNIALMNELAQIFDKLNLNTHEILDAANTKWNFLNFKPGLVGGHCISVDPYYLTYKSKKIGYDPKIIISGREVNSLMAKFIFNKIYKVAKLKKINIKESKSLILGCTFKENCSDFRNNQSVVVRQNFVKNGFHVDMYDPLVDSKKFEKTYNLKLLNSIKGNKYDIIAILVSHNVFLKMGLNNIKGLTKKKNIIFDLKNTFPKAKELLRL